MRAYEGSSTHLISPKMAEYCLLMNTTFTLFIDLTIFTSFIRVPCEELDDIRDKSGHEEVRLPHLFIKTMRLQ